MSTCGESTQCAATCPLCGRPNQCRLADQGLHKGPCWCSRTEFPAELLAQAAQPTQVARCICQACLSAFRKEAKWHPRPGPGDYYLENGKVVFTEAYHLRRAYCCESGCRHCPFGKASLQATTATGALLLAAILMTLLTMPPGIAGTKTEDFGTDPTQHGWVTRGDSTLFHWDPTRQALAVTWDSRATNSFYVLPLGTTVTLTNDFSAEFDLQLSDYGERPDKSSPLQIALGFFNLETTPVRSLTRTAGGAADLLEFDFFPDGDSGPPFGESYSTLSPVYFSDTGRVDARFSPPFNWVTNQVYHVRFAYTAADRTLRTGIEAGGTPLVTVPDFTLRDSLGSAFLDAFGVLCWNELPAKNGSILAHGWLDNVQLNLPPPPLGRLNITISDNLATISFAARAGWAYQLEFSDDLNLWKPGASGVVATDGNLSLDDAVPLASTGRSYRVTATLQ